ETPSTMLRINCPWCGLRDEIEFRYRGDAQVRRPALDATISEFTAFVYERGNLRDWHPEWWLHTGGCRRLLRVERHTLTHEIRAVEDAGAATERG
ncbi:MAG: sarcosine oxidase subunit delta, partial [Steroidobacteraceae bacterium]